MIIESEKITRKKRIDPKLIACKWEIIHNDDITSETNLTNHAVYEYPTESGHADYALFVDGKLLGVIEAKKISIGTEGVLSQAKRYSKTVQKGSGLWNKYKIPFLYSTNGELIYFLDIRNSQNISRKISSFHTPSALKEFFNRNNHSAFKWFKLNEINTISRLRNYQIKTISNIETAIRCGKNKMLVAMATGTGKTFTTISSIYRLLKSGYAKRILFLVDRRALAAQTVTTFSSFTTPEGSKFTNDYEVYSQKYKFGDFNDEKIKFNPQVLPEKYLTNPGEQHTFIYVSTIQRMAINLFGKESIESPDYDVDADKLDIPIHAFDVIIADECHRGYTAKETGTWRNVIDYFDAVKIGLTATPAGHTTALFNEVVSRYTTEEAIQDNFLVDYDAVKIKSDIKMKGAFLKEGEAVGRIDTTSGKEIYDELEDERQFEAKDIEKKITSPDSNIKIIKELKKYIYRFIDEYGRFPKTLIFAQNDLEHISHADLIVRTCKEVFNQGDDFVYKITGKVDRPLQKIREFRNRPEPKIVVTVDMLSTGVDIPAIEFIVFMRTVKSRILWVQMLGRGTRLCSEINKNKFTIVDCFDGTLIEYFKNTTDFNISLQKEVIPTPVIIEKIYNYEDRNYNLKVLKRRLLRIEKNMGGKAREEFSEFIENGDMKKFADTLKHNVENNFDEIMKVLRNKEFHDLLINYTKPKKEFLVGYDTVDTVTSQVMFKLDNNLYKPKDYLDQFADFVKEKQNEILALQIILNKQDSWNLNTLEQLRKELKESKFKEEDLQNACKIVYNKSLVDIISLIKYSAQKINVILNIEERVEKALNNVFKNIELNEEQKVWLGYIRKHLIDNYVIDIQDFEDMPVFSDHGGKKKAEKIFSQSLDELIKKINHEIAA